MNYIVIAVTALIAGIIQGIAGFGSGPIQMMSYPLLWGVSSAAAVSVCVSVPLNANMVFTYRREIKPKKLLVPLLPYMVICAIAITWSRSIDQALMKKVFGGFLILLSCYYLFLNKGNKKKLNIPTTIAYIVISALCDALFGIGGPLMVLYFLNKTDSTKEYLGTVAAFFLINGIYNSIIRAASGILTANLLPFIAIGVIFILIGVTAAHRFVDRMNDLVLKKATYIMIGITGILNILS